MLLAPPACLALPLHGVEGEISGVFNFPDSYLSPNVSYHSFPPTTVLKVGSRSIVFEGAQELKIRLLKKNEDGLMWCSKKQHGRRINIGQYHTDLSDVEVAFSFSVPKTHIFMCGYMIHTDDLVNLRIESYNAIVNVMPEHFMNVTDKSDEDSLISVNKDMFYSVIVEGADLPLYTTAVPKYVMTGDACHVEMVPSAVFYNDCERNFQIREQFSVTAEICPVSSPTSCPPLTAPVQPFSNGIFWSFVYNSLLAKRLHKDVLASAVRDLRMLHELSLRKPLEHIIGKKYDRAIHNLTNILNEAKPFPTPLRKNTCCPALCKCHLHNNPKHDILTVTRSESRSIERTDSSRLKRGESTSTELDTLNRTASYSNKISSLEFSFEAGSSNQNDRFAQQHGYEGKHRFHFGEEALGDWEDTQLLQEEPQMVQLGECVAPAFDTQKESLYHSTQPPLTITRISRPTESRLL